MVVALLTRRLASEGRGAAARQSRVVAPRVAVARKKRAWAARLRPRIAA
jgi:hypothetical protein